MTNQKILVNYAVPGALTTHLITFILKDSQAEKNGLKIGDKIISFDYMHIPTQVDH